MCIKHEGNDKLNFYRRVTYIKSLLDIFKINIMFSSFIKNLFYLVYFYYLFIYVFYFLLDISFYIYKCRPTRSSVLMNL